jgi:hypothetical protein
MHCQMHAFPRDLLARHSVLADIGEDTVRGEDTNSHHTGW